MNFLIGMSKHVNGKRYGLGLQIRSLGVDREGRNVGLNLDPLDHKLSDELMLTREEMTLLIYGMQKLVDSYDSPVVKD